MSDTQTRPITTLAELDEAIDTLQAESREPMPIVPAEATGDLSPGRAWVYGYDNKWNPLKWTRPTTNAADALAMLEWWRDKGKGHTAVIRVMAKGYEVIAQHTYENYLMAHGSYTSERFPIAASVAVARACGLTVELDAALALAREVEGG